jgi:glycogen phosphorylase
VPASHPFPFRSVPAPLERLAALALDVHWTWNHAGDSVWRRLDPALWERTQNPWLLLQYVPFERLERLASDPEFLRDIDALDGAAERYRETPPWRPSSSPARVPRVAYLSMEFGLHEALPLYAGGLGVLAGDYLKTASDLDVPVVGIGILWQQGYFRQVLGEAGQQTELYPFNEPASLPLQPVTSRDGDRLRIPLSFPGRTIMLRVWQAIVGRAALYLLDSNDPFNAPADRGLTSALYGGDVEVRLLQETILGVGGWRLVETLGLDVDLCHLNEGHAALAVVERARGFMQQHGSTFREALWATRAGNVFTTHTAVPAGFDVYGPADFPRLRPYFEEYVSELGVSWPELLALGRRDPQDANEPFNMAWLAMRGCAWVNGVSRLHGHVSRRLFAGLFPRWPEPEIPIGHVTNGVHVPTWDSPWTDALWTDAAGKERWRGDVSALTTDILRLSDEELWRLRRHECGDLVRYARDRLERQLARLGGAGAAARTARQVLDADVLTLGFARRFATYKRPNLLLTDPARLARLLTDPARPAQLIVAGKAHPRDEEGKRLIQQWTLFAERADVRSRVVFLDDYDMRLATELVQGVDVWINTPRRPWEASGTSGMKVLVNGGLNLSTRDGWWAEAFEPELGWALGDGSESAGDDSSDAATLYALLESDVVPCFYDRDASGLPRRWLARMRASMAHLTPQFSSVRMLQEYVERIYLPAAALHHRRIDGDSRVAQALDAWSRHLEQHWDEIRFGALVVHADGGRLTARVPVYFGAIDPAAVSVELYADARDADEPLVEAMPALSAVPGAANGFIHGVTIATRRAAAEFTPRVVPRHPDARVPLEMPRITWQR